MIKYIILRSTLKLMSQIYMIDCKLYFNLFSFLQDLFIPYIFVFLQELINYVSYSVESFIMHTYIQ